MMCEKCGTIYGACDDNDTFVHECGGKMVDTGIRHSELMVMRHISPNDNSFVEAMIQLKKDDIIEYNLKMSQFKSQIEQQEAEKNKIKCPRCGSTNITTGQRGFKLTTGFIGSNKTVNRCGNCGYSWKP